jgi:hypothetical protein
VEDEFSAAFFEFIHPYGEFYALVEGLAWAAAE